MELGSLQPILTGVLAVTTIAAAAFAGLMIGTQRTLRDSNKDLRDRVTDLEKERTEDHAKVARLEASDSEKEAQIASLTSMLQGRVEWSAISDQLTELTRVLVIAGEQIQTHDQRAGEWWETADDHLGRIEQLLRGGRA